MSFRKYFTKNQFAHFGFYDSDLCFCFFSLAAGHGMIDQLEDAIRYVGSLPNKKYKCFGSSKSGSRSGKQKVNKYDGFTEMADF